ncbi:MAG: dihydrolipoamide acetyltransferase family protein [Leptonema sp. (in: bacteria)]
MAKILELMQLSPTMKTGTFVKWLKKPGDAVKSDTIIAEIETDKAVMEMMAFEEGILLATLAKEGDQLSVGTPIAIIGEIGEDISNLLETAKKRINEQNIIVGQKTQTQEKIEEQQEETKTTIPIQEEKVIVSIDSKADSYSTVETKTSLEIEEFEPEKKKEKQILDRLDVEISNVISPILDRPSLNGNISLPPYISLAKSVYKTKYPISPLAKKIAQNYGIDISIIQPSDGKRITVKDVEDFIKNRQAKPIQEIKPDKKIQVTGIRKIIAERLYQSKSHIPHYYLTAEINVDSVTKLKDKMNQDLAELEPNLKLSLNDFIIRACAKSLQKHPVVNSSWQGDKIIQFGRIDIGIAVALDSGLITPYVRNADQLEFLSMVKKIREIVKRARERKLKPEEYSNGTFTVSNLGMYGIKNFSAIINEPEAAIMAVGTIEEKPIVKKNKIKIGKTISVTLSCDHRVIDGAEGASFLQTFKKYIENPHLMFM